MTDVIAIPRDENPYQELLYSEMRARGDRVVYGGELTRSRTLNLLLLPLELAWRRLSGYRVLHLHWTFGFRFTGSDRFAWVRRLSRWWFEFVLAVAGLCGLRVVWTAHNLLPHHPVFDDDRAARRRVIRHADLVIAHSPASLTEIGTAFGAPARSTVIPIGSAVPPGLAEVGPPPAGRPRTVLFFGLIERYKGVEDLLAAVAELREPLRCQIVGRCRDAALAAELERRAASLDGATLSLDYVPDDEVAAHFAVADAVVFPYRQVTTSSAVLLAGVAGRPIIVPDLPAFDGFPDDAVIRYPPGVAGLVAALERVEKAGAVELEAMGAAARRAVADTSWVDIAETTSAQFSALVSA